MNPSIVLSKKHVGPVVKVFADKNRADFAEQILLRLASDKNYAQTISQFAIERVMLSWLRIQELDRATKFVARLQDLADQQILLKGPSTSAYKTLIRAWTKSNEHNKDEQIHILQGQLEGNLERKNNQPQKCHLMK